MDALTVCIDIAHLKTQPFTQAQAQAIGGEIEDAVTEREGRQEQPFGLILILTDSVAGEFFQEMMLHRYRDDKKISSI